MFVSHWLCRTPDSKVTSYLSASVSRWHCFSHSFSHRRTKNRNIRRLFVVCSSLNGTSFCYCLCYSHHHYATQIILVLWSRAHLYAHRYPHHPTPTYITPRPPRHADKYLLRGLVWMHNFSTLERVCRWFEIEIGEMRLFQIPCRTTPVIHEHILETELNPNDVQSPVCRPKSQLRLDEQHNYIYHNRCKQENKIWKDSNKRKTKVKVEKKRVELCRAEFLSIEHVI